MEKSKKENVLIALTGDVMIGRTVDEHLSTVPSSYIWGDTLPLLKKADITLINLEAALTTSTHKVPKVFNFKAAPEKVQSLQDAHVTVCNIANNHILDFDVQGLKETLQVLDKAGIQHVGAGNNEAQAKSPVILKKNNVIIGFLGCTDNEPDWKATSSSPGVFFLDVGDMKAIEEEILALRPKVDVLILSIHWGPNMRERPPKSFREFAHQLIDKGVDIIHGHSAHIFQGIEAYKNGLILYDTGDFVDDYYVDPLLRNDRSFLFFIELDKKGFVSLFCIPTLISDYRVNLAKGKDALETIKRMEHLSFELSCPLAEKKENNIPYLFFTKEMVQ